MQKLYSVSTTVFYMHASQAIHPSQASQLGQPGQAARQVMQPPAKPVTSRALSGKMAAARIQRELLLIRLKHSLQCAIITGESRLASNSIHQKYLHEIFVISVSFPRNRDQ